MTWNRRRGSNKFNARRTQVDNIWFQSAMEARYYAEVLKPLLKAGTIMSLVVHPRFPIWISGVKIGTVILDFSYSGDDGTVYVDVKGKDNALSKWKRKTVEAAYGIKVEVITKW